MQTFLPHKNLFDVAKCLDYRRLGKQRVEAQQIIETIENNLIPWSKHPAVLMWRGYTEFLKRYFNVITSEWISRGYRNTLRYYNIDFSNYIAPKWYDEEKLYSSHRAALLFKNYQYYSQFGWIEKPELNYWWPTKNGY